MAAGTCQTQPVNSGMSGLRGAAKRMAEARDPDFCPNGHPRTAENTYTSKRANGSVKTQCKPCIRAAQRKFDAKLTTRDALRQLPEPDALGFVQRLTEGAF